METPQKGLMFLFFLLCSFRIPADVTLPSILSDRMVLQQRTEVSIWGWADPGETVTVRADWPKGGAVTSVADAEGRWQVKLATPQAGGPYTLRVRGHNEIIIRDILMGEVWLGSGQSNMEMRLSSTENASEAIAAADYPNIRLFTVPRAANQEPQRDCTGTWVECSAESIPNFSAVSYYFARKLHNELHVPVGMIHSSWGGTPAEAWTKKAALLEDAEFHPILEAWEDNIRQYPQRMQAYLQALKEWERKVAESADDENSKPAKPRAPYGPDNPRCPSVLYNAMIHPLIPYAIRGVIWYQGESNAGRAYQYRKLFPAMIRSWRESWGQGDFPFYFVQLANYKEPQDQPVEDTWAELREAQAMALTLPQTGMAVAIDIGDAKTIHPTNKKDVGERLALWALAKDYQKKNVFSGPVYRSMKIDGRRIILSFDYVDGGLIAKDGKPLSQFAIAGPDRRFVWADAQIVGDNVIVQSPQVTDPVAVRYAWQINPQGCNLFNKAGLPASPFRTDDWPGLTVGKLRP